MAFSNPNLASSYLLALSSIDLGHNVRRKSRGLPFFPTFHPQQEDYLAFPSSGKYPIVFLVV